MEDKKDKIDKGGAEGCIDIHTRMRNSIAGAIFYFVNGIRSLNLRLWFRKLALKMINSYQ